MHILSASEMTKQWHTNPRWRGIKRPTPPAGGATARLVRDRTHAGAPGRGAAVVAAAHEEYVPALGALTGNQAVQQVQAGLKAIYLSGWQVAADANDAGQMYPDQSLYPANSVPNVVRRINNALLRADQIHHLDGHTNGKKTGMYWFAPIVADAEAGFGGSLNAFELMKAMIEAGAACVHFEDQLVLGQEVRTPGRQSPGADLRSNSEAGGGASGGGRAGRADADHGAHRRQQRPSC